MARPHGPPLLNFWRHHWTDVVSSFSLVLEPLPVEGLMLPHILNSTPPRLLCRAAGSLLMSSLSVFLIYLVQTKAQSLVLSCVFSGVSVVAWNALDVLGTELYPTRLR